MTSPLEEYAEAKRSGIHPETEKNWPDKPITEDDEEPTIVPPIKPPVIDRPVTVQPPSSKLLVTTIVGFLITIALLVYLIINSRNNDTAQLYKEAPPKIVYKTKVRKIYVTKASDKWRKKYCYESGNWDACLAYKTNLPLRARIGRNDLL
jgi:hypothetical protein